MTAESDRPEAAEPAVLRIVSGHPSAEQLAALTAVLTAAGAAADQEPTGRVAAWSDPALRLRQPPPPGPGAWRNSAWS